MSKPLSDAFSILRDDVRSFIVSFHTHIKEDNIFEVENDYQVRFPKLTELYFMHNKWPPAELVGQLVDQDPMFLVLYNELYYRHIYAHLSAALSVDDMVQSYSNYCTLFNNLLSADKPVQLALPNQWLWDIIDEFIFQFQKFCGFRNRQKHKPEDEEVLHQNSRAWNIHCVLNILYSLVEKSSINEQLSYYAKQGDPDEIADEFGRCVLYKMLGFFSLIGLCRLHCLLGDYYTSIKVLENINLNRLEMYHEVPTCHITTGYFVGFSHMMMRRYQDAARMLSATLAYKNRTSSILAHRADLREYVNKQSDQMSCLLGICVTLSPSSIDHTVDADRRDKFLELLLRLQQLDESEFASSFDLGCPKFISPEMPGNPRTALTSDSVYTFGPQRQQVELFRSEISQQIKRLRLRSFLKLYTNINVSKLAAYMNCPESSVHTALMAYKHHMIQQFSSQPDPNALDTTVTGGFGLGIPSDFSSSQSQPHQQPQQLQLLTDLDFFVDSNIIHVADTTVDRRFSEYFIRQIEMLQQMNKTLDALERRVHESSVQESSNDITSLRC